MGQAVDVHRLHFAFTITFHYIFPQLTMGLALLLVYLKTKRCEPAMNITTVRHDSGRGSSGSILPWALSPASRWNSSSGRTVLRFQKRQAASSAKHWQWKACFRFFSNRASWGCFCSERKNSDAWDTGGRRFSCFSAPGSRAISSLQRTRGCNIRPVTGLAPTGPSNSPASGISLLNKWALWQYAHTMLGAVQTGCFVMAGAGAFYFADEAR